MANLQYNSLMICPDTSLLAICLIYVDTTDIWLRACLFNEVLNFYDFYLMLPNQQKVKDYKCGLVLKLGHVMVESTL